MNIQQPYSIQNPTNAQQPLTPEEQQMLSGDPAPESAESPLSAAIAATKPPAELTHLTKPDPSRFKPEEFPSSGRYTNCAVMVLAPNPGPMSHTGTNTWILADPEEETCVIVDPGPDDQAHFTNLVQCCLSMETTPVAILLTHTHFDHSEGAEPLALQLGVPVYARAAGNLPAGPLKIPYLDLDLEIVDLPGHSADCVGILIPQDKALITGDIIFAWGSTVIAADGGSLGDFLDSLDVLEDLVNEGAVEKLLVGHGHCIGDPLTYIHKYRSHRLERLALIQDALEHLGISDLNAAYKDPQAIDDIYRQVYQDTSPDLEAPAKQNILVQLQYLRTQNQKE